MYIEELLPKILFIYNFSFNCDKFFPLTIFRTVVINNNFGIVFDIKIFSLIMHALKAFIVKNKIFYSKDLFNMS